MLQTNRDLAEWVYDRLHQAKNEEVLSLDSEQMNNVEVFFSVASDKSCEVVVDFYAIYSQEFPYDASFDAILRDIEEHNVETLTKQN